MAKNTRGSPDPYGGSQGTEAVFGNANGSSLGRNQGMGGNRTNWNRMTGAPQTPSAQAQPARPATQATPATQLGAPMTPGGQAGGVGAPVLNAGRPGPGVPTGTTTLPGATTAAKPVQQTYYSDPSKLPIGGGFVRPTAGPGMLQGAGLNWMVPPPPAPVAPRNILASLLAQNQRRPTGAQRNSGGSGSGGYSTSGRGAGGNPSSAR